MRHVIVAACACLALLLAGCSKGGDGKDAKQGGGQGPRVPPAAAREPVYETRGLAQWMNDLRDEKAEVREHAAWVIGRIGGEAYGAVPNLIDALKDPSTDVRENAAWALGRIGPRAKEAIPTLEQALNDEGKRVRHNAAVALKSIREPV